MTSLRDEILFLYSMCVNQIWGKPIRALQRIFMFDGFEILLLPINSRWIDTATNKNWRIWEDLWDTFSWFIPVELCNNGVCRKWTFRYYSRVFSFHCCEIYLAHWTSTKSSNLKSRSERADRQIAIRIHGGGVPRARPMTAHSNDLMTLFICTSTSHCPSPLREHNTRCKRRRRGPWTPRTKGQTRWCRTENSEQVFVLVCW